MSEKEKAVALLEKVPEYKMGYVIAYLQGITADEPNAETLEALEEVKRMKADPSIGKSYSNVDEMMEELLHA